MFTTGRLIFALCFVVIFIAGMVYSYKKEKNTRQIHYKRSYLVFAGIVLFMTALFLIVKMKKFF